MISVVVTVLNEGDHMRRLLDSLVAQTLAPDDVVIVDGGSQDDTVQVGQSYADRLPLRVLSAPGANISAGRNRGIAAARGDIIAVTDAGVRLHEAWLERITLPFDDPRVDVVGGFFRADATTLFEAAMGAAVLPGQGEIDAHHFLPSSRSVAFRKSAWAAVGGYPEWLDYCEDLIFDLRLKQRGEIALQRGAVVYFRPRGSLPAFFRQYYRYARGDGKADLFRRRHAIRYATYLFLLPALVLAGLRLHRTLWLLVVPAGLLYLKHPFRRLLSVMRWTGYGSPGHILAAAALLPVIRLTGDVAKMLGYPVGLAWRWRHRPPGWK